MSVTDTSVKRETISMLMGLILENVAGISHVLLGPMMLHCCIVMEMERCTPLLETSPREA